ncbi:MAG: hypothetical protein WC728_02575 [Elusimicrobiota bacterium]
MRGLRLWSRGPRSAAFLRLRRGPRLILALLLPAALCRPAVALPGRAGEAGAQFLRLGAGVRSLGMGDAYSAVADGPEAVYWNPAGIAQLRAPEFSYARSEHLGLFHHDFAAYVHPVEAWRGALGLAVTHVSQTRLPLVDKDNVVVGDFSPYSMAVAAAYARDFSSGDRAFDEGPFRCKLSGSSLSFDDCDSQDFRYGAEERVLLGGFSVKGIVESLHDHKAWAAALDAGVLLRPASAERLSLSLCVRHLGTQEKFIREKTDLPLEGAAGASYELGWEKGRFVPALEFTAPAYGEPSGNLGGEYTTRLGEDAGASFRFGYKTLTVKDLGPMSGFTVGLGLRLRRLSVDFGFQPAAALGQTFRMGASWRFLGIRDPLELRREPRKKSPWSDRPWERSPWR